MDFSNMIHYISTSSIARFTSVFHDYADNFAL